MVNISRYQIQLDRPNGVYVAGEDVVGTLHLTTLSEIACRGVRLKLTGKGYVYWHHGHDDEREDHYGRREYVSKSITILGNFHRTATLDGAGANAYFDPNSGGGEMVIALDDEKVDDDFVLAVRSMDLDWGKKDDLLGETLVHVAQDLLQNPGEQKSFPLRRKGNIQGKAEVTLSAYVDQVMGKYVLRLVCHQTTGLRSADFFGKNDVYVQCYPVPPDTDEGAPLPNPETKYTIAAGTQLSVPFSIKLPLKYVPSSFSSWHGDACYVNYSLYSNIDIAMWQDPSIRRYITVLSSELPSPTLLAPMLRTNTEPQTIYGCDCCGLTCCDNGDAYFRAALDKTYFSPGEAVFITAFAENNTEDACAFTVTLWQKATMCANSNERRQIPLEHKLLTDVVPAGGTLEWTTTNPKMFIVPSVPPTFLEGKAKGLNEIWQQRDPLSWHYVLSITMDMPGMFATDIFWNVPVTVGAFPVYSLKAMDPEKYGANLDAIETAGVGTDDPPPPIDDAEYPPPEFEPTELVASAVPVDNSQLRAAEDEHNENQFNVGGQPPIYAPAYPVTEVRSSAHENLPDCGSDPSLPEE